MSRPLFSILLPSRNRLELLKHALASIQIQDCSDFEVIVADNGSDDPYAENLQSYAPMDIRIVRSDSPVSVTKNWNVAIEAARGEYAIMLGDDDALTPGLLGRLRETIRRFDRPDVIYQMAYHYAYPGVFESEQNGYLCSVNNSELFDLADQPYELELSRARKVGRRAMNFHHDISFNAQHFIWKLDYVRTIGFSPFFQSPYPDYFACFTTFLTAARIVVVPTPEIIIGIAKQSFGFYFANSRQSEGAQQFLGEDVDQEALAEGDQGILEALHHPGSVHTRNWLFAALFAKRALAFRSDIAVDVRRYGRIQSFELAQRAGYLKTLDTEEFWADFGKLPPLSQRFTKELLKTFRTLGRVHGFHKPSISHGLFDLLNVYHTPKLHMLAIGAHQNIMDVVRWLGRDVTKDVHVPPPESEVVVLTRQLQLLNEEMLQVHAERDAVQEQHNALQIERDAVISERDAVISERDTVVSERDAVTSERDAVISQRDAVTSERDAIVNSTSWRATFPLRSVIGRMRNVNIKALGVRKRLRSQISRRPMLKKGLIALLRGNGAIRLAQSTVVSRPAETTAAGAAAPPMRIGGGTQRETILRSQLFDEQWYLQKYRDVANAGIDPITHYLEYGTQEGRNPNPLFDTSWYLTYYPDVAAAGANPLAHYVEYGSREQEGRDPHPGFSTLYYFAQNPDVAAAGINPLLHYLREGKAAGRLPFDPNANYSKHVISERQFFALEASQIRSHIAAMLYRPVFQVFVTGAKGAEYTRTLESLQAQIYDAWSSSDFAWDVSGSRQFESDENAFVMFLPAGDTLNPSALYRLASMINASPSSDIIYGDEDTIDRDGTRRLPFYKPDWSPDTLESLNYLGPAACFRGALAATVLAEARSYYDFVLRATEQTSRVEHVRAIVAHRASGATDEIAAEDGAAEIAALAGRLQRTGRTGEVTAVAPGTACYSTKLSLASEPLVSVVIPTAGTVTDLDGVPTDLLFNCLDKIASRSTYKKLEFVIVDNGDLGEARVEQLRQRGCRRITFSERNFNVAKKLNLGASIATGSMLLLLNDDIEPLSPDWIERLLEQFEKPHVGVVGAKLLFSDLTTQHTGVVTNLGNPEHVRKMRSRDDFGYFFSARSVRNFSAVTGACMLTPTDLYRRIGGYNEALAISYNDVDYCLKVRQEGLTVVFAPGAELIHFESQSRIPMLDLGEADYFHQRWARMVISDPYYNEDNLEVLPASFEVKHNLRVL